MTAPTTNPTTNTNVSLLGQSTAQSERLASLRAQMNDLSRVVTTGQVADTYSGLGTTASTVLNLNNQQPLLQSYLNNITTASNNMTMMNNAMQQISDVGNQLITALQTQETNNPTDIQNIQQLAQQGLQTVESMLNQTNANGQYMFAGSDCTSPPFVDDSALNSNFVNQINSWLTTGNTAALTGAVSSFTPTNLGLAAGLATSGNVTTQISDNLNVNYTVNADQPGFQNIIRALTLVANTPIPSGADTATATDFNNVMNYALTTAQAGVNEVNDTASTLAGTFDQCKTVQTNTQSDLTMVQNQISGLTAADTTTAITEMQALQTQLTASYQVTNMVSNLSLVNYITIPAAG